MLFLLFLIRTSTFLTELGLNSELEGSVFSHPGLSLPSQICHADTRYCRQWFKTWPLPKWKWNGKVKMKWQKAAIISKSFITRFNSLPGQEERKGEGEKERIATHGHMPWKKGRDDNSFRNSGRVWRVRTVVHTELFLKSKEKVSQPWSG